MIRLYNQLGIPLRKSQSLCISGHTMYIAVAVVLGKARSPLKGIPKWVAVIPRRVSSKSFKGMDYLIKN